MEIFELTSNVPKPNAGIFTPLLSVIFGTLTISVVVLQLFTRTKTIFTDKLTLD